MTCSQFRSLLLCLCDDDDDDMELNVLRCWADILGTNCDQCVCMVQCCFTSTYPYGSLRWGTQDGLLDFYAAPEFCASSFQC